MGSGTDWKRHVHRLAGQQHGIVLRSQVVGSAPSESAARHELRQHHWDELRPSLYRLVGSPRCELQSVMADVLEVGSGAVVSHYSAAALWGVAGATIEPTHLTRPRHSSGRHPTSAIVHEARRLGQDQITTLHGLPLTRPERVPFDLANIGVHADRVERILDRLWSDRLVSGRSLRRVLQSLPRRGFRGTAMMRAFLDARGDDWIPPASGLEGRAMRLLAEAGLGRFERQVDIGGDEWVGRVDFVNRQRRVVIEVQSDRHHAALSNQRDDARRIERLEAAGFTVVAVWEDDIWHRPAEFLARVRRIDPKPATGGTK